MLNKVLKGLGEILSQLASEQARIDILEAEVRGLKAQLLYRQPISINTPTWNNPHWQQNPQFTSKSTA